jgi:transcriptional regulator with XRE-family HTH domain
MEKKQLHAVDVHVGQKIRDARRLAGLSQTELAELIGVTFQQLQKYENAYNRVSCSRLFAISRALDVPVQAFFAGAEISGASAPEEGNPPPDNPLDLVFVYSQFSPALRRNVANAAKSLSDWARSTDQAV